MGLFNNQPAQNERALLAGRYRSARINLLFVVALTAINIVMLATGSDGYFVFSANIPYLLALFGAIYTGRLPEEYYEGGYGEYVFLDSWVFGVMIAISLVIVGVYLVFYLLSSKERVGWLIAAEVFFAFDTVAMFAYYGFDFSMILDIILHLYVVVSFGMGIHAALKLKKMPDEPIVAPVGEGYAEGETAIGEPGAEETVADTDDTAE